MLILRSYHFDIVIL